MSWIAGYAYCAIAALSFLNRLPRQSPTINKEQARYGLTNIPATIRWLVSRQVVYDEENDEEEEEPEDPTQKQREALAGIYNDASLGPIISHQDDEFVGFNGRCNKMVDTCYAFWVVASLDVRLGKY